MATKKLEIKTPAMSVISPEAIQKVDQEENKEIKRETTGKKGRPRVKQKKKQYSLTLNPDLYDETFEKADELGISFSALVTMAIKDFLNK